MASKRSLDSRAAIAHLRKVDPVLGRLIDQVGAFKLRHEPEHFQALVQAIMFQQLAGAACQAILDRFVALFPGAPFPTPAQVLEATDEQLRGAGLSRQKLAYMRDLAKHVSEDLLNFKRFPRMEDEEVIAELIRVKGIGRWTAEMFLMFNLRRPDVLPVGDLGFQTAAMRAYGMKQLPTAKRLKELGERWRPYRSVAVWYLWQMIRMKLPYGDGAARAKPAKRKRATARRVVIATS
ncbi:MAG TPA: DNA-3-methyladenine glycosylase [Candidatus Binataceae bacterium]|nr:DNA-3-methyladenine glycosylase [Candidatus Binataceae bacterium]